MKVEVQTFPAVVSYRGVLRLLFASTRPQEWVKNTFVFAPLFFSQNLLNLDLLAKSFVAFVFFCLASGGVYLINDICDRERDKKHPQKSGRPIASGALSVLVATTAAIALLSTAMIGALLVNVPLGLITFSYVALNFVYSNWLKHGLLLLSPFHRANVQSKICRSFRSSQESQGELFYRDERISFLLWGKTCLLGSVE